MTYILNFPESYFSATLGDFFYQGSCGSRGSAFLLESPTEGALGKKFVWEGLDGQEKQDAQEQMGLLRRKKMS